MERSEPHNLGQPDGSGDTTTQARLAAIESHLRLIEALLVGVSQFNTRLDQIHATLELAVGVLAPGQHTGSPEPQPAPNDGAQAGSNSGFRIIAHVSRESHGARLVSDVSWSDMWSIRLYVTALLRNAMRSGLTSAECRCWCEIWTPNEGGELVDSAHVDPETGVIEWESDMATGK
jgi:hypothetical protein